MDSQPSGLLPHVIRNAFHHQVRQHGHELLTFVAEELCGPPSGISITLQRLEWPESQVNWVWFVGSADAATEQAILHFFQADVGKRALVSDSPDAIEFKLASTLLRLPDGQEKDPALPAGFTAAAMPPRHDQKVMVLSGFPSYPICVPAETNSWLQASPHMEFSQVFSFELQGQANADTGSFGAWLVDNDASVAFGRVAAVVGARGVLTTPLAEQS